MIRAASQHGFVFKIKRLATHIMMSVHAINYCPASLPLIVDRQMLIIAGKGC